MTAYTPWLGGTQRGVLSTLRGAKLEVEKIDAEHTIARTGVLSIEVKGDPITQATLVAPPDDMFPRSFEAFMGLVGMPADDELRSWMKRHLSAYAGVIRESGVSATGPIAERGTDTCTLTLGLLGPLLYVTLDTP